jgi:hypothetical protein
MKKIIASALIAIATISIAATLPAPSTAQAFCSTPDCG